MKPIKLTLTAFGPYKNCEIIDFRELKNNRLFVVSGTTGSGKTTIFDAICFALYGTASGEDRSDTKMLRSDFAEDDTHTGVQLEFELRNRKYRILRQLSHVKEGNKSATGEKYEFFEVTSNGELPCVDRQIVSEINKKVETLLGLSQDQFSQIVMLPQGEFRKLLTSQTENKEEILRKIFKTDHYKKMSERLKEKKTRIEEVFKQEAIRRDSYINNIPAVLSLRENSSLKTVLSQEHYNVNQILKSLEDEVSFYEEQMSKDQKNYDYAYQKHDLKLAEYHIAKALNERFHVLDEKTKKIEELDTKLPEVKNKEIKYEQGERASHIRVYEEQLYTLNEELLEKTKYQQNSIFEEKEAKEQLETTTNQFEIEKGRKRDREEVTTLLTHLNGYLTEVKDIKNRKELLEELTKESNQYTNLINESTTKIEDIKKMKEELGKNIKEKESIVNQLPDIQEKHAELRERFKLIKDVIQLQEQLDTLELNVEKAEKAYNKSLEKYQQIEIEWVNSQARVLATHLHDGSACPVCGSLEHPNKASHANVIVTKEQLDSAKSETTMFETNYRTILADYRSTESQLQLKEGEVTSLKTSSIKNEESYLLQEGKRLRARLDELQNIRAQLQPLREKHDGVEIELDSITQKKVKVDEQYLETKSKYDSNKAILEEKLQNIPEDVQDLSKLENRIKEVEQLKTSLEEAWENLQKEHQNSITAYTSSKLKVEHAKMQLDEVLVRKERATLQFDQALSDAQFNTKEEYFNAKLPKEKLLLLKNEITSFKQLHSSIAQQVTELQIELKGKQRVDLSEIEQILKDLKIAYESALQAYNLSKDYKSEGEKLLFKIRNIEKQLEEHEKQLSIITDLYDVVRGQNSSKISFERYLQIEYLEQIILAANERLKDLSNGQFYLIRSDRQESRGKQSGLGLDVYDAYTGTTRDVKTLSGGEKFNASLCLALGMADVIQSFQGGVSIDTMFIDEGFGSLDEESLQKSIDTLIELQQSGRMIGVISHVQELKSSIPAILEVTKSKEGYSRTQFVLK
ncbi:AAA family ATPase [Litchfieldia salsa]|uniref:Nuclease SbcCD subunit C n=1 Tax=Litchfieldia salsa TaxID=930152 RepID=A0A1H0TCW4_9BACI|nr:SMC family ATPase [Litchfieldia salsa]SDP51356.1 exonuclease SbcC [Litchfieldia salsa]